MGKRQKLDYNSEELVRNLKQSTGQGVDALFSPPSPPRPETAEEPQAPAEQDRSVQARTYARTRVRKQARSHTSIEQELREQVLIKKHLSSFTFRFHTEELEALARITDEINRNGKHKTSKNDVMRLALNWLLRDHQEKKENSMLAKVLART
jgi:hypothetical protein